MFGKNEVASARAEDFALHSIFYTLQGEGPWAGKPAVFVRLADCNLRCYFCDTDFTSQREILSAQMLASRILQACIRHDCTSVVITGGEPMLQPLPLMMTNFGGHLLRFQIETAGTCWPKGMEAWTTREAEGVWGRMYLVVSPKTPKLHPEIMQWAGAWKYIVTRADYENMRDRMGDGLPSQSTQIQGEAASICRPPMGAHVYVQPMDEGDPSVNIQNAAAAAAICMGRGYRLSLQMHKMVGVE